MVDPARRVLLDLRTVVPPPCVLPLTRDRWETVVADGEIDGLVPRIEPLLLGVLDAADSTPQRLPRAAWELAAAVQEQAHNLWCVQAFHPSAPGLADAIRRTLIDASVVALDAASGDGGVRTLDDARAELSQAVARLLDITESFVFPKDQSHAAFGVAYDELIDERGIFSPSRLLAAYYGRYYQLALRFGSLLSVLTIQPPDILNALGPAEALALSGRPLITLRTAVRIRDLFESYIATDIEALARPMRELKLNVERSATSHAALLRLSAQCEQASTDSERAAIELDMYRRTVEGQLRPWAWSLLQVLSRTAARVPELSSIRDQLLSEHNPLLTDAARAILPEVRNAAAHEDYEWDDDRGVLLVGDAEIHPDEVEDATDRAYCFMMGAEAAWRCARYSSSTFSAALDADDPRGGSAALNVRQAIGHFGTNGLEVRRWSHEKRVLTVVLDRLPFRLINPCFQAVMWASRHLETTERFVVTTPGALRPAMDLPRAPLDASFVVWREAATRFTAMPLSVFMPANTWARLKVEPPHAAARASAWHALNDAVLAYEEAHEDAGLVNERLSALVDRLNLITTAISATMATLPAEAVAPLADVLQLTSSAAAATAAAERGLSGAPAAEMENRIRYVYGLLPSASVLPTVDPRPLDLIAD